MLTKRENLLNLLMVLTAFALGFFFYPILPEMMASHWNSLGEVDGYIGKFWGTMLMPIIMTLVFLLLAYIPKIDPLKENISKFKKYYGFFKSIVMLFLFYIYVLTLVWNFGFPFNFTVFIVPAFSLLIYMSGVMMGHAKRNYMVGIRTPWTLSSDKVWDKTHLLAGRFFKASAIVALLGIFFPGRAVTLLFLPVLFSVIFAVVFSYKEFTRIKNAK